MHDPPSVQDDVESGQAKLLLIPGNLPGAPELPAPRPEDLPITVKLYARFYTAIHLALYEHRDTIERHQRRVPPKRSWLLVDVDAHGARVSSRIYGKRQLNQFERIRDERFAQYVVFCNREFQFPVYVRRADGSAEFFASPSILPWQQLVRNQHHALPSLAQPTRDAFSDDKAMEFMNKMFTPRTASSCAACGRGAGQLSKSPMAAPALSYTRTLQSCACRQVRYCGTECQRQHWPIHKPACTFYAAKSSRPQG